MNILISGGTGLIGNAIGIELSKKHSLYVLTRDTKKANLTCSYPQTPIHYNEIKSHPILKDLHSIINLAGAGLNDKRWNPSYKKTIYNSRIQTTGMLCDLATHHCPNLKSFISTSAIGIYGDHGDKLINEDSIKSNDFIGKLCQDWEQPVLNIKTARTVILRLGIVFSESGGALEKMVPPIRSGFGGTLLNGSQYMSWIDIEDLVNIFITSTEDNLTGIFNAVAPNPESNKNISLDIARHLKRPLLFKVPYFALKILLGEMAKYIVESQKVSSMKIQNEGFHFKYKYVKDSITKRIPT